MKERNKRVDVVPEFHTWLKIEAIRRGKTIPAFTREFMKDKKTEVSSFDFKF